MRTVLVAVAAVIAVGAAVWVATGGGPGQPGASSIGDPIVEAGLDPDGNPLRGQVVLRTAADSEVAVEIRGPDGTGRRVTATEPADGRTTVPLLGLRPDTTYTVTASVDGATGTREVTTGPLPAFFPPVEAEGDPGSGVTLMDVRYWGGSEQQREDGDGFVVGVDGSGAVVWYLRTLLAQEDAERTADGDIAFLWDEGGVRTYSPSGELQRAVAGTIPREEVTEDEHGHPTATGDAIPAEAAAMHHELVQLGDGNILTLSREVREISGFPEPICDHEDEPFDGSYTVGGDVIVELDPETGETVRRWSIFDYASPLDHLDKIVASSFCGGYLNPRFPDRAPVRDWTHANALAIDEGRNAVLASLRHLDQIWAFRWEDSADGPAGELLWKLGAGGDFELRGDGGWFYYQHAPEVQPDGSLLVYDNGNYRPGTDPGDAGALPYSRAVRYELDTETMTARQVWEHRVGTARDPLYAPFLGDADRVGDGDVLIAHGGAVDPPTNQIFSEGTTQYARILQVDPADGRTVWEATVRGESLGWSVYRAERIPTLYPPRFEVEPL